jgi:EF hand domain-containing protein
MIRTLGSMALLSLLIAVPAFAQSQEECMDCVEKEIRKFFVGNDEWTETEAQCCDWPCTGGWTMKDEDVGWGCLIDTWDNPVFLHLGTHCNSSDRDEGCPPDDPPPPDDNGTIPCTPGEPGCGSPIILDLGENGYRLTSISGGVHFDLRNDGRKVQMAWTRLGVENAFLALDRNGNGQIDNGSELFGNYTPLRNGALAANGFVALAELDRNHDGLINPSDPVWPKLLLWIDRNHDGFSTGDEVQRVSNSIIVALETDHQTIRKKDQWGNLFRYKARFWFHQNGRRQHRVYYDVFLLMGD